MIRDELRTRIERLLGAAVETYRHVQGGYTPATRLLCRTRKGDFFVKAGATPLTSEFLRSEIEAYQRIAGAFVPKLVAWEEHETEPILIIEDLSSACWPPPWDERQVVCVAEQIQEMHRTKAPLKSFLQTHGTFAPNWQTVAEEPAPFLSLGIADARWLEKALPVLLEQEQRCPMDGDSLVHLDLRSDNICLADQGVLFVDWNHACLANPRIDLGFWLPSLAYEGGPLPETILPDAPDVAALVAGFFASRAGLPGIPDAPRVRLVQRQQLQTALPWAVRALDLPPPSPSLSV